MITDILILRSFFSTFFPSFLPDYIQDRCGQNPLNGPKRWEKGRRLIESRSFRCSLLFKSSSHKLKRALESKSNKEWSEASVRKTVLCLLDHTWGFPSHDKTTDTSESPPTAWSFLLQPLTETRTQLSKLSTFEHILGNGNPYLERRLMTATEDRKVSKRDVLPGIWWEAALSFWAVAGDAGRSVSVITVKGLGSRRDLFIFKWFKWFVASERERICLWKLKPAGWISVLQTTKLKTVPSGRVLTL